MSSNEKKRLRDRRSQQTLREKKLRHAAQLEEKVAHCEQHHNDQSVQRLLQVIKGLRKQNDTLLTHQKSLKSLVNSWEIEPDESILSDHSRQDLSSLYTEISNREAQFALQTNFNESIPEQARNHFLNAPIPTVSTPSQIPSPCLEPLSDEHMPLWKQIPPHVDDFSTKTLISCQWFLYPELIIPCPDVPNSPLDFLYGTKTNPLADMIHTALVRRPIRDPERLCTGWLTYHFSRWIIAPSPETYGRLPVFLRPVQGQMTLPHPLVLDFLPWPRIRLNLIRRWHLYSKDRDALFGFMACCVKIRWPWNETILERDERNELCIKKAFYDMFMSESGWGLTPEFIRRYPDLVEGMDISQIVIELL
ncbi:uncharacterized protein N7479_009661 [Penicillium vulpinum]|uniref:BZIP domain-containing protein n=1 Tax=Penicillium vulpinum TaxID=29845 RepID=A0A1V6RF55_9EURO|nr:uncharacterized protein N7479_009661 [Penicillium vulpinum]KAJ5951248.1 hypothetical protein N7479_009661 [Penicillium vulpinum]OQE00435.1 hypothetical protein PENVUL_c052G03822 [Penicillium vulpinum]